MVAVSLATAAVKDSQPNQTRQDVALHNKLNLLESPQSGPE
jgi:hypothetical protein